MQSWKYIQDMLKKIPYWVSVVRVSIVQYVHEQQMTLEYIFSFYIMILLICLPRPKQMHNMYFRANENPNIFQHIFGIALVFFIKIPKKKIYQQQNRKCFLFTTKKKMESISRTCVTFTLLTNLIIIITNTDFSLIFVLRKEDENYFARVLCVSSSFWLLRVESRYFSQAEKERTTWKAEQIHKMTNTFAQNCPRF